MPRCASKMLIKQINFLNQIITDHM